MRANFKPQAMSLWDKYDNHLRTESGKNPAHFKRKGVIMLPLISGDLTCVA